MADHQARKTVDPTCTHRKRLRPPNVVQPHRSYAARMVTPRCATSMPRSLICSQLCHTSLNKVRYPVNVLTWLRDGRRCITANQNGEFTLWNGMAFNFEGLIAAHNSAVRALAWSHSGITLLSGDTKGCIKYWEHTMTPVKELLGTHGGQSIRGLKFSPTDGKFCSCADDGAVRIWDWELFKEERVLSGHGWDVKAVDWHATYGLIASGSKDNQVKLWDPRKRQCAATLYGHKHTVMDVKWNRANDNWLLTASRDQTLKLYDIRVLKDALTFRGHNREVTCCTWHPFNERLFASGAFDGTLNHWLVGHDEPLQTHHAHEQSIWDLEWHPVGHVLATASNDHRTKFWCRPRPGDDLALQPDQKARVVKLQTALDVLAAREKERVDAEAATQAALVEAPAASLGADGGDQRMIDGDDDVVDQKPPPLGRALFQQPPPDNIMLGGGHHHHHHHHHHQQQPPPILGGYHQQPPPILGGYHQPPPILGGQQQPHHQQPPPPVLGGAQRPY